MSTLVQSSHALTSGHGFNWREWAILTVAGIASVFASLPGLWSVLEQTAEKVGMSMPALIALQTASSLVQIGALVAIGLFFAHRIGLGAPILERWLEGEAVGNQIRAILLPAISLGTLAAIAIIMSDRLVFRPFLPNFSTVSTEVSGWQGFLAAFYGGIMEELQTRLVYVSVLAWLFGKVSHTSAGTPSRGAFWAAIGIAAIIFGLGHLPAASLSVAITPLVVLRAIVLNGIGGVLFGVMYWKRGLEAAMLTHFSSDIVLRVLLPLLTSLLA